MAAKKYNFSGELAATLSVDMGPHASVSHVWDKPVAT